MHKSEIEIIKDAGIVGAGGAGFPTHIKLNTQVETLIINGAECEPLINVDKQDTILCLSTIRNKE